MLDLDGTDAWVENNIFLHCHRNGSPDSSSAISGGNYDFGGSDGVRTSEITIIGNLFFDCDNACDAKEGNFYTFYNNTIVHTTKVGGMDIDSGVVNLRDTTAGLTAFGAGTYLEGNIISDAEKLVRNYDSITVHRHVQQQHSAVCLGGAGRRQCHRRSVVQACAAGGGNSFHDLEPGADHARLVEPCCRDRRPSAPARTDWIKAAWFRWAPLLPANRPARTIPLQPP